MATLSNKNSNPLIKSKYKNFLPFGHYTKRLALNPKHVELDMPNLLNVQLENFFYFVNHRIDQIFREVFPIVNDSKSIKIEYISCEFKKASEDLKEIKDQGKNYEAALYAKFALYKNNKKDSEKKVFICFFPWMTKQASFIINGVEKVVVSQFLKSPGIYFNKFHDLNGSDISYFNLTPLLGTWIEIKINDKKLISVKINKTKKIQLSSLFTCLGLDLNLLNEIFDNNKFIINTFAKEDILDKKTAIINLLHKINPSEPLLNQKDKIIELFKKHFFSPHYYDLSKAGRYKLNQKINFVDRLFNYRIAKDIRTNDNKVLIAKDKVIHQEEIDLIQDAIDKNILKKQQLYLPDFDDVEYYTFYIYHPNQLVDEEKQLVKIITPAKLDNEKVCLDLIDFISIINYLLNLAIDIGSVDDIDDISSRRIRVVSELIENQLKFAFIKMKKNIHEMMISSSIESLNLKKLINSKAIISVIKEFFNISQLCQFIDQTNPLSEFSNKRKISSLGPKGLTKERAGLEVRDVHNSHYNRICPIESPEGPNIGLILNLGCYSRINNLGFIETPYFVVKNRTITNEVKYLDGTQEKKYVIFSYNPKFLNKSKIVSEEVIASYNSEFIVTNASNVELASVSPKQLISVATACIPFLENNDANRALMGANMQRQAVPLLKAEAPLIATGIEHKIATDSNVAIVAEEDGKVVYVDANEMVVEYASDKKRKVTIPLSVFQKTNHNTCKTHVPLLTINDKFKKGQVLADGQAMKDGELALGRNVLVGFCTWYGYNFEDAIIISERIAKDDVFTSLHIEEFVVEARITNQGHEEITRDILNVSESHLKYLDSDGIIIPGARVHSGDILVGKVTPREEISSTPEDKLLQVIFGEKSRHFKDSSLRVPVGSGGIVVDVKRFLKQKKDNLPSDVSEMIKVYILQKRKLQAGDKMSGRHGNKGVVSVIVPEEDMPFLEDGTPIDILLNPLGVPVRMNIGQILETELGLAANKLGIKVVTPVFEAPSEMQITEFVKDANLPEDCKFSVIDGKTGERFDNKILVGYMYMLKLSHMVEDKIHARAIGPYSLITQQPLGGKAQNGGQRCGEMEVWAFEGYGAAHLLQELLTIKSDDVIGRIKTYESIIWENKTYKPNIPESFLVLASELKGLGINIELKRK
ncbi:DNA-directed RNA polymerase subunit beta [Mycoplasma sp. SG1]|nr:DNA-directed RNA polymerase subunit beta [Mycoplasma sp. SG1]URM52883.1 DNA-directed RNA polymerase subunit beta [Mycoplasma sp. SG1]